MTDIPLNFVSEISVNLKNNEVVAFDIAAMKNKRLSSREIEQTIEAFLEETGDDVSNIEFHINIKQVAETVTEKVTRLLDQ
jgi:hypothetical protein